MAEKKDNNAKQDNREHTEGNLETTRQKGSTGKEEQKTKKILSEICTKKLYTLSHQQTPTSARMLT